MTTTTVKERPILFNGDMVRAILDGRQTMTRRVVKPQPIRIRCQSGQGECYDAWPNGNSCLTWDDVLLDPIYYAKCGHCPYGQPGDRLWVRETFAEYGTSRKHPNIGSPILYKATYKPSDCDDLWRPSIHMPRSASRITLEVTDVRVERVQEISGAGAVAEGCGKGIPDYQLLHEGGYRKARHEFSALWDSLNAKRGYSWESNPWVWVVEFKRMEGDGE